MPTLMSVIFKLHVYDSVNESDVWASSGTDHEHLGNLEYNDVFIVIENINKRWVKIFCKFGVAYAWENAVKHYAEKINDR